MPELKHTFQGGKMEKDKDERIVPNGQYREALNISVSTSEDSDVGAAQNILGNICVTQAAQGRTQTNTTITGLVNNEFADDNYHIAEIVDPQSDMLYRFIHTPSPSEGIWMDRIIEYDTTKPLDASWQEKEAAVVVDIFKVKAEVTSVGDPCAGGSNKTMIRINKNLPQLRWGMRVEQGDDVAFIEIIDYVTGWITLDTSWNGGVGEVYFYGNRNLNFSNRRTITGINIIDGMLFWTDNYSEPKKIDIQRSKKGSNTSLWSTTTGLIGRFSGLPIPKIDDFIQHTVLVVKEEPRYDCVTSDLLGSGCPDKDYVQSTTIDTSTPGCTDPTANNYNAAATVDDGSCTYDESFYEDAQQQTGAGFNLGSYQGTQTVVMQEEEANQSLGA